MEFDKKLELCGELMSQDYGITEKQARNIIFDLSIEDAVIEYYQDAIDEAEEEQRERWREEIRNNPDIYGGY